MTTENQEPKAGQSAAVERPKLPSLAKSKALRVLLRIAKQDHVDHKSLLLLLILINAHPRLTAHYRIFENLAALIETPPVLDYLEDHPEAQGQIIIWKNLCQWVIGNKSRLAQMADLSEFDYTPPAAGSGTAPHPLNRNIHGFTRNGACSCLFNRHESAPDYDTLPTQGSAAYQYLCLQAQLLVSYVQCRMIPGMLRQMFCNTGKDEWPALPVSSYSVSVAIRHLNHQRYAGLLANLNSDASFNDFNQHLHSVKIPADVAQGLVEEEADAVLQQVELYLSYLQKYFNAVDKHLRGQYKKKIRGSGKASSHRRFSGTRTGFIHLGEGIWLEEPDKKEEDEDIPYSGSLEIQVEDVQDDPDGKETERSGLALEEARTAVLKLYDPDEFGQAMMQAKHAEMARRMSAQRFAWDYEALTTTELKRFWSLVDVTISSALSSHERWTVQTSNQVQCALVLKIMLILGQSMGTVRNLKISRDGKTDHEGIVYHPATDDSQGWWQLPSIEPKYRTEIPAARNGLGRAKSGYLCLPDLSGIGLDLVEYLARMNRTLDRVFSVEPATAKQGIEALLSRLAETWIVPGTKARKIISEATQQTMQRITPSKIRNALGIRLRFISGDAAVEWITSANLERRNETRLHYTNLSEQQVVGAYSSVLRRLMKDAGNPLKPSQPKQASSNGSHGARFVASMESVKRLVINLSTELDRKLDRTDRTDLIRYHNWYTFYVWLMQSLYTGHRAVNNPDTLIAALSDRPTTLFGGISDKENSTLADKARLVMLPEPLQKQLLRYLHHVEKLIRKFDGNLFDALKQKDTSSNLFYLDKKGNPLPVTCGWCESMMEKLKVPLPGNFHRAFLRTELIERACPAQVVDAFLGHANIGESPYFTFSSMDYQRWADNIQPMLIPLVQETGITCQSSQLVTK